MLISVALAFVVVVDAIAIGGVGLCVALAFVVVAMGDLCLSRVLAEVLVVLGLLFDMLIDERFIVLLKVFEFCIGDGRMGYLQRLVHDCLKLVLDVVNFGEDSLGQHVGGHGKKGK